MRNVDNFTDDARLDVAYAVADILNVRGMATVPRHPYSPNLVPRDFWLFLEVKKIQYQSKKSSKLRRHNFRSSRKMVWLSCLESVKNGRKSVLELRAGSLRKRTA